MKRVVDIALSAIGLVVLSPLLLVIGLMVWRSSPGGILHVHDRVGRDERIFACYKFRTMRPGAPVAGTHEVPASWVTPTGRWLRSAKLDELPQLCNVLRGDMSLVGPRPCLPTQLEVIEERRRAGVFAVRPGITGLAQLAGIDMSRPAELARADRAYMDSRTILLDLALLARTVLTATRGRRG